MTADSNTAIVVRVSDGQSPRLSKEDIPIPHPAANQVLVKLSHIAQNPTDVQSFDANAFGDGAVLGCDFVGDVVELGSNITRLAKGDIVAGLVWGGEIKGLGAYSRYCLADERISFKLPKSVSHAHASTIALAPITAWLASFPRDCLALDCSQGKGKSVLIWSGSTSVGLYAIQIASRCGLDVVTTCSPKHADLVLSYGTFCTVRPGKANTGNVVQGTRVTDVLVWMAFLKDHSYGEFKWPASKHDHELAVELFERKPEWLENGSLKPNRPKVIPGLDAVADGFQEYKDGKISAYKIVYEL
ncbi:hypothetical protein BDW71DRAFT_217419 [Aspergillus fruticulosus]